MEISSTEEIVYEGMALSSKDVNILEDILLNEPGSFSIHAKLTVYYFFAQNRGLSYREHDLRFQHIEWLIHEHPDHEFCGYPFMHVRKKERPADYEMLKARFLEAVHAHDQEVNVLRNAARFLMLEDPEAAATMYEKILSRDVYDRSTTKELARAYSLEAVQKGEQDETFLAKAAELYTGLLENASRSEKAFLYLDIAQCYWVTGEMSKCRDVALCAIDHSIPESGGHEAKVLHEANSILGLLSIADNDISAAADFLIKSTELGQSGEIELAMPNLRLANELLRKDQARIVIAFLANCRHFWRYGVESGLIDRWISDISAGRSPDLRIDEDSLTE